MSNNYKYVGKPRPLADGLEKVTGMARYVADLTVPNMLYGRPVLSPYAHAEILSIDREEACKMPGVVAVLTAEELPTRNKVIRSRNTAVLAKGKVLWVGQPVVLVLAESEKQAADAAERVYIDYEPLPAAVKLAAAIKPDSPIVWPNGMPKEGDGLESLHADTGDGATTEDDGKPNNVLTHNHFARGDVATGFAAAEVIVERRYHIESVHQLYMEPHAALVVPDRMGARHDRLHKHPGAIRRARSACKNV